jgi:hypothetical protein
MFTSVEATLKPRAEDDQQYSTISFKNGFSFTGALLSAKKRANQALAFPSVTECHQHVSIEESEKV